MKKNSKPVIFIIIFFLVFVTGILLVAQGLRLKCEELIRERTHLDGKIRSHKINRVSLIASYQMYTAEDVIKKYATGQLGLIENNMESSKKVILKKELIEETEKELKNKYE
jgi:hypothetical protein